MRGIARPHGPAVHELVRRYGSFSLAASVDQPDMSFFIGENGAIAYTATFSGARTTRIALGEPLAPPEEWASLVHEFLLDADNAVFVNVGDEMCALLVEEGLTVNNIGWEAVLDLRDYNFQGSGKQNIRNAVRRCKREGFYVEEVTGVPAHRAELTSVSQSWLRRRGGLRPENRLLTRPFDPDSAFQRVFAMKNADAHVVHFVTVDEIWQENEVIGYHANINRGLDLAPKNADYAVQATIVEKLQAESVSHLSLGLCPVLESNAYGRQRNDYMALALSAAYRYGKVVYNLQGISAHKAEFRPQYRRPVYVCCPNPWPFIDVASVFQACNYV